VSAAPDPEAELQAALESSFRYLGHRDRTVAEVRRHLERRDTAQPAIEGALAELARLGYLDDARFARRFAEDRRRLDAWGADRIERRLAELGVDRHDVAAALAAEHDELATAVALLRRRLGRPPAEERERERALGLLARRGYDLEVAYDAVRAFERGHAA
jgi:regulatory protein